LTASVKEYLADRPYAATIIANAGAGAVTSGVGALATNALIRNKALAKALNSSRSLLGLAPVAHVTGRKALLPVLRSAGLGAVGGGLFSVPSAKHTSNIVNNPEYRAKAVKGEAGDFARVMSVLSQPVESLARVVLKPELGKNIVTDAFYTGGGLGGAGAAALHGRYSGKQENAMNRFVGNKSAGVGSAISGAARGVKDMVVSDASHLGKYLKVNGRRMARAAGDSKLKRHAGSVLRAGGKFIQDNPGKALAGAGAVPFGGGFAAGALARRKKNKPEEEKKEATFIRENSMRRRNYATKSAAYTMYKRAAELRQYAAEKRAYADAVREYYGIDKDAALGAFLGKALGAGKDLAGKALTSGRGLAGKALTSGKDLAGRAGAGLTRLGSGAARVAGTATPEALAAGDLSKVTGLGGKLFRGAEKLINTEGPGIVNGLKRVAGLGSAVGGALSTGAGQVMSRNPLLTGGALAGGGLLAGGYGINRLAGGGRQPAVPVQGNI
jgi:hypothetical protein